MVDNVFIIIIIITTGTFCGFNTLNGLKLLFDSHRELYILEIIWGKNNNKCIIIIYKKIYIYFSKICIW